MSEKRVRFDGSLSRNKKQEKPTQPSHKGSCTIDGVAYWISGYVNESRDNGEKYFKLYFEPKTPKEQGEPVIMVNPTEPTDDDPDIPF
jgi:hypothetical protein